MHHCNQKQIITFAGLPRSTAFAYALFFSVALAVYSLLWPTAPIIAPDSGKYLRFAQDLSGFYIQTVHERGPGYPLLLIITNSSQSPQRTLFFLSLLLHFGCIWLLASLLYRAGLAEMTLNLFSFVLLLPFYVESAAYVLSENLTEAVLVATLVSFIYWYHDKKTSWILISAATIGYAALTRPTYQLLALAIAGSLLLVRGFLIRIHLKWPDVIRASALLICGSFVVIGVYSVFNYRNVGYLGVTPKLGLSLSTRTVHVIERLPDEYAVVREALLKARNSVVMEEGLSEEYMYIWGAVPELSRITGLRYPELSDFMLRLNLLLIRIAPLNYLQEVVWAFGSYWFPSATDLANFHSSLFQTVWAVFHFLLMTVFASSLLVLIGAGLFIKICSHAAADTNTVSSSEREQINFQILMYVTASAIVFYTCAISCLIEVGNPRYRVPTDALIVFMCFLGPHLLRHVVRLSTIKFCSSGDC